jgi:hypothetical protein
MVARPQHRSCPPRVRLHAGVPPLRSTARGDMVCPDTSEVGVAVFWVLGRPLSRAIRPLPSVHSSVGRRRHQEARRWLVFRAATREEGGGGCEGGAARAAATTQVLRFHRPKEAAMKVKEAGVQMKEPAPLVKKWWEEECNTPATPWPGPVTPGLAPQTNTSLFCALCPHSCALGKDFPVGHPSSNRSRPSTLNLEFFTDELPEKKVYLVDMSILSILSSPKPGCHTLTPLEDRRPRRSTPGTSPLGHVCASSAGICATTDPMPAPLTRTRPCYREGRL